MKYIDKIIEGEQNFKEFWSQFRKGEKIEWCSEFGYCGEVKIELFYERSDKEELEGKPFREFYWLTMPSIGTKGFFHFSDRRKEIHEMIRKGKIISQRFE